MAVLAAGQGSRKGRIPFEDRATQMAEILRFSLPINERTVIVQSCIYSSFARIEQAVAEQLARTVLKDLPRWHAPDVNPVALETEAAGCGSAGLWSTLRLRQWRSGL